MPINNRLKIVFVHIPKTGGSSIEESLDMYGFQNSGENSIFDPTILFGHELQLMTADEIFAYLEANRFDPYKYLWISVVRNPFDRFVSEYLWRSRWDIRLQNMDIIKKNIISTFNQFFIKGES